MSVRPGIVLAASPGAYDGPSSRPNGPEPVEGSVLDGTRHADPVFPGRRTLPTELPIE